MTALKAKDDPTIWEVDDALWERIQPLLIIHKFRKKPGRPRKDNRQILIGLIWIARTGSQWSALPRRFGAKSTVHDRFQEWVEAGVFEKTWALLLQEFDELEGIDWTWQAADGCIVKAPLGKRGLMARRKQPGATPPTGGKAAPSATSGPTDVACRWRS
jgi:putative transposase